MVIGDEFPGGFAGAEDVIQPVGLRFGFEIGIEDDEEGVAVFEGIGAFFFDGGGAVGKKRELFEVKGSDGRPGIRGCR